MIPKGEHSVRPDLNHPDPQYLRRWTDRVWLRDNGHCRLCGKFAEFVDQMEVHHLTYERWGLEEVDDGILLCKSCHEKVTKKTRALREEATQDEYFRNS